MAALLLRDGRRPTRPSRCVTPNRDIKSVTRLADSSSSDGEAGVRDRRMISRGGVIDVGTNRVDDPTRSRGYRLVGDVNFAERSRWPGRSPCAGRSRADDHHDAAVQHRAGGEAVGHSLDLFALFAEGAWTVTQVTRRPRGRGSPISCHCGCAGRSPVKRGRAVTGTSRARPQRQIRCVMFQKDNRRLPGPRRMGCRCSSSRGHVWRRRGVPLTRGDRLRSTEAAGCAAGLEKARPPRQGRAADPARNGRCRRTVRIEWSRSRRPPCRTSRGDTRGPLAGGRAAGCVRPRAGRGRRKG